MAFRRYAYGSAPMHDPAHRVASYNFQCPRAPRLQRIDEDMASASPSDPAPPKTFSRAVARPSDPAPLKTFSRVVARPKVAPSVGARWMKDGKMLARVTSHWDAVEDCAAATATSEDRECSKEERVARDSLLRFHNCEHVSVAVSIRYGADGESCDECGICAIAETGGFLPLAFRKQKMEIHTADDRPFYNEDTILSFYCVRECMHAANCGCKSVGHSPQDCARKRSAAKISPLREACKQRFYACARDIIAMHQAHEAACTFAEDRDEPLPVEDEQALSCCWNAHLSDQFPIYTCMAALELTTGHRFDCPIPTVYCTWSPVSSPLAYDAKSRIVVACAENPILARGIIEAQLARILDPGYFLCVLANDEVRRELPIARFGARRWDSKDVAWKMVSLADDIIRRSGYNGAPLRPSREKTEALLAFIATRVACGRLLLKEDASARTDAPLRVFRPADPRVQKIDDADAPVFPSALNAKTRAQLAADLTY